MAKSIRSKSRIRARNVLREAVYNPAVNQRLQRCLARLHKNSRVIEPPALGAVEEPPRRFSFLPLFTSHRHENELTAVPQAPQSGDSTLDAVQMPDAQAPFNPADPQLMTLPTQVSIVKRGKKNSRKNQTATSSRVKMSKTTTPKATNSNRKSIAVPNARAKRDAAKASLSHRRRKFVW